MTVHLLGVLGRRLALVALAVAGCGGNGTAGAVDGAADAGAPSELVDATPNGPEAGDGAAPPAPLGAACLRSSDCASQLCGPNGRCAELAIEVIDAPVGRGLFAAVRQDGRASVAFEDQANRSVSFAVEGPSGWTVEPTGLVPHILAYAPDPDRLVLCGTDGQLSFARREAASDGFSLSFLHGAPPCTQARDIDAHIQGDQVALAWAAPPNVLAVRDATAPDAAAEVVAALPVTASAVSAPRLGPAADGRLWLAYTSLPGPGANRRQLSVAEPAAAPAWNVSVVHPSVEAAVGCLIRDGLGTWIATQSETGAVLVDDAGGPWRGTMAEAWLWPGARCGILPGGTVAYTRAGSLALELRWSRNGSTDRAAVTFDGAAPRNGCTAGAPHQLLARPNGLLWLASTAAPAAPADCRLTAIQLRDQGSK